MLVNVYAWCLPISLLPALIPSRECVGIGLAHQVRVSVLLGMSLFGTGMAVQVVDTNGRTHTVVVPAIAKDIARPFGGVALRAQGADVILIAHSVTDGGPYDVIEAGGG